MSLLSNFIPFAAGGGINSIQTGFVSGNMTIVPGTSNANEDSGYYDVTISSVTTSKAVPDFFGAVGAGNALQLNPVYFNYFTGASVGIVLPRLTSSTNIRLAYPGGKNAEDNTGGANKIVGRWYVIEAK